MQLKDLVDNIQKYCINSGKVQRFHFDFKDQIDVFSKEYDTFPMVFVSPVMNTNIVNGNGFRGNTIMLDVFVLDKINDDRTNIITIMNETNNIISDITNYMNNIKGIEMTEYSPIIPYNDYTVSMLAGHMISIELLISTNVDCVFPTMDCEPSTINITNTIGDLLDSITLLSGETIPYIIPDSNLHITIKNQYDIVYDESDVIVVANTDESIDISIITGAPTYNVQNSNNTFNIDINADTVLDDTNHKVNLLNSDSVEILTNDYAIPSVINQTDGIVIDDSKVEIMLNGILQETVYVKFGDTVTITFE